MAVECRSSGSRLSHSLLLSSSLLCISRTRERTDTKLWSLQRREKPDKSGYVNLFILIQSNLPHQQPGMFLSICRNSYLCAIQPICLATILAVHLSKHLYWMQIPAVWSAQPPHLSRRWKCRRSVRDGRNKTLPFGGNISCKRQKS